MPSIVDRILARAGYQRDEKKTPSGSVARANGSPALFSSVGYNYASNLTSQAEQLRSYQDWVYAAAHLIAEDVATIDFKLFVNRTGAKSVSLSSKLAESPSFARKAAERKVLVKSAGKYVRKSSVEEIESHPMLDLLASPNPHMTKDEVIETVMLHMLLAGESFVAIIRDSKGMPLYLYPLMPNQVRIVPDSVDFIAGYVYYPPNGQQVPFDVKDVVHFKYVNPSNPYRGMGVVQAAARSVDTDAHAAEWNRIFFYNSAMPEGVITVPETLGDGAFQRLKQEWNATYGGTSNARKVALLEQGAEFKPIGISQKEMDFLETRKFNMTQILAMFRVPPELLGISGNSNRSTAEAVEYSFTKHVIKPNMKRIANRITMDLASQYDEKLVVAFTDPVPEDKEFALKEKESGVNSWLTIDEVRAMEGKEELEGGMGATIYVNSTLVPIGTAIEGQHDSEEDLEDEIGEPLETDEGRDPDSQEDEEAEEEEPDGSKKAYAPELPKKFHEGGEDRSAKGESFHAEVGRIASSFERKFLKECRSYFDAQMASVLGSLAAAKSFSKRSMKDYVPDRQGQDDDFSKAFGPLYEELYREAGNAAMLLVSDGDVDMGSPDVARFLEERPLLAAESINSETEKQLKATLSEGISAGESYAELAARVRSVYGAAAGYRADRIARTESINAAHAANVEAWKQSGVVASKEWYTSKDEAVCPFCSEMDGTVIGLEANFFDVGSEMEVPSKDGKNQVLKLDFTDVAHPPLHVSCRCDVLPVLK